MFCLLFFFFFFFVFFFNDTAPTEISPLPLHAALPISHPEQRASTIVPRRSSRKCPISASPDRKSTRLNSSHRWISYAGFFLQKRRGPSSQETKANGPRGGRRARPRNRPH